MRGRVRTLARSEVGRSRPGKPLLYGESNSVAESCGARRSGPWPPRQRLTAPLQTLPALRGGRAASECARKGLHPSSHGGHSRRATAKYHPGYDGVPGGAQGLRALTFVSITIRTLPGSTTLATKLLKTASNSPPPKNNHVTCMTHTRSRPALSAARATSVMRDYCNLEFLFQITINARRSSPTCRAHGVGGRQTLDAAVAGIADTA